MLSPNKSFSFSVQKFNDMSNCKYMGLPCIIVENEVI